MFKHHINTRTHPRVYVRTELASIDDYFSVHPYLGEKSIKYIHALLDKHATGMTKTKILVLMIYFTVTSRLHRETFSWGHTAIPSGQRQAISAGQSHERIAIAGTTIYNTNPAPRHHS